jgi:predicted metalloprotease with PDZ domain
MKGRANFPNRVKKRQEEALRRQAAHAELTVDEKFGKLDAWLGANVGAVKERTRLAQQVSNVASESPAPTTV